MRLTGLHTNAMVKATMVYSCSFQLGIYHLKDSLRQRALSLPQGYSAIAGSVNQALSLI